VVEQQSDKVLTANPAGSPATGNGRGNGTEQIFAEVLAGIVGVERISPDSNFFDDLDADSLLMAQFCARVRKRENAPSVSMKDVYRNPTIRSLAASVTAAVPAPEQTPPEVPAEAPPPPSTPRYVLCGALQLVFFLGYIYLGAVVLASGYGWITEGSGLFEMYLRAVSFCAAGFAAVCAFPVLVKWTLIGRWKPQRIRIWSLAYFRFWVVKALVRSNPLVLFAGSPLFVLYLKALGVQIGRDVAIFSKNVPVCTDLLTIGDGSVIRKDSYLNCYRAHAGMIETGAVTLGRNVFVGEAAVIDIRASMGDGGQLGHSSSLHAGQAVPGGECWNGSPAARAEADYRVVGPAGCGVLRKVTYSGAQLLNMLLVYLPLALGGTDMLLAEFPHTGALFGSGRLDLTSWTFLRDALALSFVLYFGAVLIGLLLVFSVPRLLNLAIKPDRVYGLYGFHYSAHRAISRLTNVKLFTRIFGDSSYIVDYLRFLGYDLSRVEQTGSNFGTEVRHETPYLVSVGSGTMVADGLSIVNADFSNTSFRVSRASIGPHNFLGNRIIYPSQSRTGDNCLLATKVMVPADGPVREDTGLLGSPSFEIPRSVERDSRFDHMKDGDEFRRRLSAKNKYNLRTMGLFLLLQWLHLFGIVLLGIAASDLYSEFGATALAGEILLVLLFTTVYFMVLERAAARFRPLQPKFCSIYEPYFWWHERFWKLVIPEYIDKRFSGTPFKNVVSRLLGVRLGKRVFDDGCSIPERTLTTIGDDCTLNLGSVIQCHSQEDGTFKADRTRLGAGATLGVGAFVHYGVTIGDGAVLAADSFLMKGEEIPQHARWGGNPARKIDSEQYQPA
jgi:non-ribosomal peptide synthetase-like protein